MNRIAARTVSRTLPSTARTMSSSAYTSPFAPRPDEKLTLSSTVPLPNGLTMPRFGIGTWEMFGDEPVTALKHAVEKLGYLHIDTAEYYRNNVGKFVHSTSVPREKLFVTTKTFAKGPNAKSSIERTTAKENMDYWDLVLIHAPDGGRQARLSAWEGLSELVKAGKIKALGVSNYGEKHIKELLDSKPDVLPVTNQIECHPFFAQVPLRKYCEEHKIPVQSYCPLARGEYYSDATLKEVAQSNNKTPAQIMLRWGVQSGLVPLPKSSNPDRQAENADALVGGWALSDDDMRKLDGLDRGSSGAVEIQTMSQNAA